MEKRSDEMFLAENNCVKDEKGNIVKNGLCAHLFVGIDPLRDAYKSLICLEFPKRNFYTLKKERHTYVLGRPLYLELYNWVNEHISDIKTSINLFGVSFIIRIDDEERLVSARDILTDETNLRNSSCCLADLLTSKLESTIETMM